MRGLAFAITLLFIGFIMLADPAWAEDVFSPPPLGQGHKLELAKLWKLTDLLQLDEQKAAKLFPVMSKYDRQIREKFIEKLETGKKLKAHIDGVSKLSESELTQLARRIWTLDQEIARLQLERFDAVSKLLTPEEAAKYSVFEIVFHEEIRKAIRKMRGQKAPQNILPQGKPPALMEEEPDLN